MNRFLFQQIPHWSELLKNILLLLLLVSAAAAQQPADVIFINGNIHPSSTAKPVSAIAIKDGKVQQIGSDDEVRKFAGVKTQTIDLHGAYAMPGFNDAHSHLASGGFGK